MSTDEYTIIVNGQRFTVTRDQLESEPGNYFAIYFGGDFQEAANNATEIIIHKEPLLFILIQAHLRGYKVVPIPDACVPNYMTRQGALENLLLDAQYFSMSRLEALVQEEIEASVAREKSEKIQGQRIYQLWSHYFLNDDDNQRVLAEGFTKRIVPLSPGGLQNFYSDHHRTITTCEICTRLSPGWELEAFLIEKGTSTFEPRMHWVVESKLSL